MINYMQENSYKINIEICGDFQTTIKEQKIKSVHTMKSKY